MSRFPHTQVSFEEYVKLEPTGGAGARQQLVLVPVGRFPVSAARLLEVLRSFTEVYFDTPTRVAPHLPFPALERRTRVRGGRQYTQYRTSAILDRLLAPRLPRDAICLLGITFDDLYPEPRWNYAFGEATLDERVGVYSLARLFRDFRLPPASPDSDRLGLERSLKVLGHETGHMFSLHHCRTHECLMNGSNSLDETDRSPLYLGPHCLKKLQYNLRFDILSRYHRLQSFYASHGLAEHATWVAQRLQRLGPL